MSSTSAYRLGSPPDLPPHARMSTAPATKFESASSMGVASTNVADSDDAWTPWHTNLFRNDPALSAPSMPGSTRSAFGSPMPTPHVVYPRPEQPLPHQHPALQTARAFLSQDSTVDNFFASYDAMAKDLLAALDTPPPSALPSPHMGIAMSILQQHVPETVEDKLPGRSEPGYDCPRMPCHDMDMGFAPGEPSFDRVSFRPQVRDKSLDVDLAQGEPAFHNTPSRPQFHDRAHYFGPGLARDPTTAPTTIKPHRLPEYRAPFQPTQREPNTWRPSRRVYHSSGIGTGGSSVMILPHRRQYHGPPFGDLFERLQQVPGVSERAEPPTTFLSRQFNRNERYPGPPPPSIAPPPPHPAPPTRAMDFHIDHDPLAPPRLDTLTDAPLLRTVYFADPATRDLAAAELAKRAWRYHPHLRRWFAPNPGKHDFYKVYDLAVDQVREFPGATLRATAVAAERGDADALSVLDADTPAGEVQGQIPMPIGVRQAQMSFGTGQPQMPVEVRSISPPQATVDARIMVSSRQQQQQQQQQQPHLTRTDDGQHRSHGSQGYGQSDFRMPGPATTSSAARSPPFATTAPPGLAEQPYYGPRHAHALQHPTPRTDVGCTTSDVSSSASKPSTGAPHKDSAHVSVEDLRVLTKLQEELAAVTAGGVPPPSRAAVHELLQSVHQILQNQTSADLP
ncbi:hypothetical protein AMAG_08553 [Allomyces macrogynus ATCC 38327]|uniref:NOT2/NOT3/NOT5 C-terminal domain-containing protein n=1 Tax=Allomyces macrogynus (strain ATCC 38327) TaxID=578462 RepID=A0A0L0SLN1_ALLM3|nr:hypothetical protein AMAG_08553 [Allomyces macrogynus ATCC 38327]|eukprot:KNE63422.1 hypothetical protein AMAG_08553 [Allomyces macrogynus ATCC 38327]